MTIMSIAATRMYRSLANFASESTEVSDLRLFSPPLSVLTVVGVIQLNRKSANERSHSPEDQGSTTRTGSANPDGRNLAFRLRAVIRVVIST
jgi:hypothetical protein